MFKFYKPVSGVEESKLSSDLLNRINLYPLEGKDIFDYDKSLLFVVEHNDKKITRCKMRKQ